MNFSSKWNLLPNRHWILRLYPWPYIRFWICRQKRCKNDHDYEIFIIVTIICLRLWCRLSIKQSWNCVNENQSLTYELPLVGGVTDFRRLCQLHANKVYRTIKNRTVCFQECFRLLSLATVLRKYPSWFQNPITLSFEIAMSTF